jgi:hypothetical protein
LIIVDGSCAATCPRKGATGTCAQADPPIARETRSAGMRPKCNVITET